jgi:MtN3 and saliva related transmembrane protein
MDVLFIIGMVAATLTTASFLPQVIKAHRSKHTRDLSLVMFLLLSAGIVLWIVYGVLLREAPIIIANSVTLGLCSYLIYLKTRYG